LATQLGIAAIDLASEDRGLMAALQGAKVAAAQPEGRPRPARWEMDWLTRTNQRRARSTSSASGSS
jgi:hypothetical protein